MTIKEMNNNKLLVGDFVRIYQDTKSENDNIYVVTGIKKYGKNEWLVDMILIRGLYVDRSHGKPIERNVGYERHIYSRNLQKVKVTIED